MRTVRLELLRHGPPHNQLLSPLTPYLALCENHAPVTLSVSFEHNQFLHRLSALAYEIDEKHRQFQLNDTGREIGKLLAAIPGLTAELSRECEDAKGFTHLRLILSASELALLPFELAQAGNGFPGAGQPLLLQNDLPLCMTREVRRVGENRLRWPTDARVLFVCASPAGLQAVPLESHLLALRRAVTPWVGYFRTDDQDERRAEVERRLKILPRASIDAIERECASGEYTHVHVLAHGVAHKVGFDVRFGLALHDEANPDGEPDVVSGERLATALRPVHQPANAALVRPMVVTLASCNSGNVGSVVGVGASVAHALHEAGIPLVVAGQFPLSFGGSVKLVEVMYEGLLWGVDPRALLVDLRRQLHTLRPDNHDWASLAAYAALPADFESQLAEVRVRRARHAIDTAMNFADKVTSEAMKSRESAAGTERARPRGRGQAGAGIDADPMMLRRAHQKIERAITRLEALVEPSPDKLRSEVLGLLGSAEKRFAEVMYWASQAPAADATKNYAEDVKVHLRRARSQYWQCFRKEKTGTAWAIVQFVVLSIVLAAVDGSPSPEDSSPDDPEQRLAALWTTAVELSLNELGGTSAQVGWALGNLIELNLIASRIKDVARPPGFASHLEAARRYAQQLAATQAREPFQIYSTRRQLRRYAWWFAEMTALGTVRNTARQLLALLPESSD